MRKLFRNYFNSTKSESSSISSTLILNNEEPAKVIISESIPMALRRCAVHLMPITVSIVIIVLNIRGTYWGADLMSPVKSETLNLLLLQLAAKLQEVMIVASLGVIVLQFVRNELLFGDGLPLGLLGAGITFNNFEFFFQREFYGALRHVASCSDKPRKILFIIIVVAAGLIAILAGPASAVLLVPKSQDWKAGGTNFYLRGTESQFWPDDLSSDVSELQSFCGPDNTTDLGVCPGGGYKSLWAHWGTLNSTNFQTQNIRPYSKEVSGSRFFWPVSSPSSLIPPLYALGDLQPGPDGRTTLIQPHAGAAAVLQKLAEDWWGALTAQPGMSPDQVDDRVISAEFKSAIAVTRCAEPHRLSASNTTAYFPSINGRFDFADNLPLDIGYLNLTKANHLRFQWVHLPSEFGAASIGGLFESQWEEAHNDGSSEASRAVFGCTVQAGWVPATVFTDKYTFWTGWYPWNIQFGDRTPAWDASSSTPTNGRIAFGDDWLRLLTPQAPFNAPGTSTWQPTTVESIFLNAGLATNTAFITGTGPMLEEEWLANNNQSFNRVSLVESILCSIVVDGLSRTGSYRAFNTSRTESKWTLTGYRQLSNFQDRILHSKPALEAPPGSANDYTTIKTNMEISGFSFQSSLASFLAMSVLFAHILMATLHIIYVLRKRHTSSSWGTVGELIALSQNSRPAYNTLANTGGGIKSSKTYARVAKIRVRRLPNSPDQEHVELLFDESSAPDDSDRDSVSGSEMDDLRDSWLQHPATWPQQRRIKVSIGTHADNRSSSTSTERLVVPSMLPEEEGLVQPNHAYL